MAQTISLPVVDSVNIQPAENVKIIASHIAEILALHEKMKKAYFWSPPGSAMARRSYESNHSDSYDCEFEIETQMKTKVKSEKFILNLSCNTSCSCKNIYYSGSFFVNGEKTTSKRIKTFLSILENEPDRVKF